MPASPAETRSTPRPWDFDHDILRSLHGLGGVWIGTLQRPDDVAFVVEAVNAYDALRAAACKDPTLHSVADAPLRPLSDLLRAATEFVDAYDLYDRVVVDDVSDKLDALRAAVRALQGPPAPFRPQQAHAAPANGGQS